MKRIGFIGLLLVMILSIAQLTCNLPAQIPTKAADTSAPPPTLTPAAWTATPIPTSTPEPTITPTPYPTADLTARPLVWFGPLPPMQVKPGRPFIGSMDFMDLFKPEAPWQTAASHVQVFKLFGEWVSEDATDEQLKQVFADLQRRGIAVDVDEGPLTASAECGNAVEGFAGINEGRHIARRVRTAGGAIDLIDMDEPFAFASIYNGPNACHWSPEKVAQGVYEYVQAMQQEFPQAIIGISEPFWQGMVVGDLENFIEAYRKVSGSYFPFFHLDLDYSIADWPQVAKEIETYCKERGIAFGIYYVGNWTDGSDETWLSMASERVKTYELQNGGNPDHVIFQSWNDHPDYSLPETKQNTFTYFVDQYFQDKAALGMRTSGPGANLAFGKKVTASHYIKGFEPQRAVDGSPDTWWGAGDFPQQWVEIDLGSPSTIASIRLKISQSPTGLTVHRLLIKGPGTGGQFTLLHEFKGNTNDLDVLTFKTCHARETDSICPRFDREEPILGSVAGDRDYRQRVIFRPNHVSMLLIKELHQYRGEHIQVNVVGLAFQRALPGIGYGLGQFAGRIVHERQVHQVGSPIHHQRCRLDLSGPIQRRKTVFTHNRRIME